MNSDEDDSSYKWNNKRKFETSQFIKARSSLDDEPQSSDSNSGNKRKNRKQKSSK